MRYLIHGLIHSPEGPIEDGFVTLDGPTILQVGPMSDLGPTEGEVLDVEGRQVIPGLIDLHIHGIRGMDVMEGGIVGMAEVLPSYGVTAFVPTTVPAPLDRLAIVLGNVAALSGSAASGARVLGAHLEGPFISPRRPGTLDADFIRPFDTIAFEELWEASEGRILQVTLAPEIGANLGAIPQLVERGIVVSIGHTDATFDEAQEAIAMGASHATHAFNAMRGLHHREPGTVGAILHSGQLVAELIADGVHVHPAVMGLLFRVKGADKVATVSDAMPPTGLPPGRYQWGRMEIIVAEERSKLADGTIAGSVKPLIEGFRLLMRRLGLPFQTALASVTRTPARVLGLKKGDLRPGYDGDVVVLDEHLQPWVTLVGGEVAFAQDGVRFSK